MVIDIIIPCFNAHNTLDRLLASIAMQTVVDDCMVYLVDDCSEHGYEPFVKRWSELMNIEVITLEKNVGPGAARQAGLDESDGDYIVFCDADDTLATAHALEMMARTMAKENADIVSGRFVEEIGDGTFIPHNNDLVWVFAKMYRRKTIERFLVRFNDTRANEDTGFNTVLSNLTDRIVNIPQTVYTWHYSPSTITRKNNGEYSWASGHKGYIENMAWAVDELKKRNVNKEIIRNLAVSVLCRLYFMHENVMANAYWNKDDSAETIQKFYDSCIKDLVLSGALHFSYIAECYKTIAKETYRNPNDAEVIHRVTFRDYLRSLGYYDDVKLMEANYDNA